MSSEKYIGLDVHQATISVAVMNSEGKVVMESILETKASTLLEFFGGLRGSLFVTFEEGTWAAWLYDLLKPHVTEVLVCNPRKIPLLKHGNKSDKIDARKLAERLRLHDLKPVYHGETGVRMLRELARSYLTVVKDLSRVMNRLKALRKIPSLEPIRSALAVALIQTPHRFRSKRQLWTYSGLGLETRDSGEYHYVQGQVRRRKKQATIRGLNHDYNHDLKGLFKGAATGARRQGNIFSFQSREKNVLDFCSYRSRYFANHRPVE